MRAICSIIKSMRYYTGSHWLIDVFRREYVNTIL